MDLHNLCMGCMSPREEAPVCLRCGYEHSSQPASPLHLAPHTQLQNGQYLIGRVLGHGGFGITYIGWENNLERKLAVKEYFPSGVAMRTGQGDEVASYSGTHQKDFEYGLERYLEEARLLARFANHPNILSVLNFFRQNGTAYIVMEYLEGRTLEKYLDQMGGRISFEEAIQLLTPVMHALEEVHEAGILHRDVSPDNIHLGSANKQVKLLDFGAARLALGERSRNLSVILKEGYAPSEQYRSKGHQGPWTDVYALAATLYRCVTGFLPPPALDRMTDDELKPLNHFGVAVGADHQQAMTNAMAFDPRQRFQTMREFREAITAPLRRVSMAYADPAQQSHAQAVTIAVSHRVPSAHPQSVGAQVSTESPFPPPEGVLHTQSDAPAAARVPAWVWSAGGAVLVVGLAVGTVNYLRQPPTSPSTAPQQQPVAATVTAPQSQTQQIAPPQPQPPETPPPTPEPKPEDRYEALLQQARTLPAERSIATLQEAAQLLPAKPDAYNLLAQASLYDLGKPLEAAAYYQQAIQAGGFATFRVVHEVRDAAEQVVAGGGELRVGRDSVTYVDRQATHTFSKRKNEVKPLPGGALRRPELRKRIAAGGFALELASGERYLFVGTSAHRVAEREMIVRLISGR